MSSRSFHPFIVTLAALPASILISCAAASQPASPPATDPSHESTDLSDQTAVIETFQDPSQARPDRINAAAQLIDHIEDSEALAALWTALRDPAQAPIVLEAIVRRGSPPRVLWTHVRAAASAPPHTAPHAEADTIVGAVAAFRSAECVRLLVNLAQTYPKPEIRQSAKAQLSILFNKPGLAFNDSTLVEWLDARRTWSDDRWQEDLQSAQLKRLRDEQLRAERAERRLVEFARKTWVATPEETRPTLLQDLLRSDVDALRSLASELIRELVASGKVVPALAQEEVLALLASPKPLVRADAARLVIQIAPQTAGPSVLQALLQERDPRVAQPLLLAITRWPTPEAVEPVLAWLERADRTAIPAADATYALHRAGLLSSQPAKNRVRASIRAMQPRELNGSACQLLVAIGDEDDQAFVVSFLEDQRQALRLAAATALATRAEHTETLLEAATADPMFVDIAARAVQTHRPTAEGIRQLDPFAQANAQAVERAQRAIARKLPIPELLSLAARFDADPCKKAESLVVLIERTLAEEATDVQRQVHNAALAMLAHARFECGLPAQAIAAFSLMDPASLSDIDRHTFARARIRTADLSAALNLAAPATIWLEEHARLGSPDDTERKTALATFIVKNFAEAISAESLAMLQSELAAVPDKAADTEDLVQAEPPPDQKPQSQDGTD